MQKKAGTNSSADELRKRYEELVEEVENERKLLVEERERVHQAILKAKSTGGQVLQKRVEKEQGGKLKELEIKENFMKYLLILQQQNMLMLLFKFYNLTSQVMLVIN